MRFLLFAAAALLGGYGVGCGDDGSTPTPDAGPIDASRPDTGPRPDAGLPGISLTEFCDQLKVDYFEFLSGCYGTASYDPSDTDEIDRIGAPCYSGMPSIDDGRLAFDGAAAAACLTALESENCDRFVFFSDVPECENLFTGLVPVGGDCYPGATPYFSHGGATECADGFCTATGCPGTCRAFAGDGQTCGGTDAVVCADGLHCRSGTCRPDIEERQPCADGACAAGLQCLPPMPPPEPTCQVPVIVGDGCAVSAVCEQGSFCSAGTCRSKVGTGEPCEANTQCPEGDRCFGDPDGPGGPQQGTCTTLAQVDDPCVADNDCDRSLFCATDTCQALPVLDEPCAPSGSPNRCATGLWCRLTGVGFDGVCSAPGARDAACAHFFGPAQTSDGVCEDDLFCMPNAVCLPPGGNDEQCLAAIGETCQPDHFCDPTTQLCRPAAAMGESCSVAFADTCADGLGCACSTGAFPCGASGPADTCQPIVTEGGACARDSECETGFCEGPGTCAVRGGFACRP